VEKCSLNTQKSWKVVKQCFREAARFPVSKTAVSLHPVRLSSESVTRVRHAEEVQHS